MWQRTASLENTGEHDIALAEASESYPVRPDRWTRGDMLRRSVADQLLSRHSAAQLDAADIDHVFAL